MTGGGPPRPEVIGTYAYSNAFEMSRICYAHAGALITGFVPVASP